MNVKLKRGIAVLLPVLGVAVAGIAGAQLITEPYEDGVTTIIEQDRVLVAQAEPVLLNDQTIYLEPNETVIVVSEPPLVVAQAPVFTGTEATYRVITPVIELPRSVSRRSGEGSGEEIALRTAPVDIRAGLSPLYVVDQSPGT